MRVKIDGLKRQMKATIQMNKRRSASPGSYSAQRPNVRRVKSVKERGVALLRLRSGIRPTVSMGAGGSLQTSSSPGIRLGSRRLHLRTVGWCLLVATWVAAVSCWFSSTPLLAQSVCLPAPRLLTVMPMGGQAGTEFEVTLSGQHLEGTEQLIFSNPAIVATPKLDKDGAAVANQFVVRIDPDCEVGLYDARVMAGLGISSARAFSVSDLRELHQTKACTSIDTAMEVPLDSIVNGALVDRNVNHHLFRAKANQRIVVDCAGKGIDSKLNPVVAIAGADGSDLIVERRGGVIEFDVPADGAYLIKVHDLTYRGGAYYFYRLMVRSQSTDSRASRLPRVASVSSFSWPPEGSSTDAATLEVEPNNQLAEAQSIELPCDLHGRFYPAADVDSYEFQATKGEQWWVEVASERLGRPTDPSVVVQRLVEDGSPVDVVELSDIASPVKRSSNGYSYDGPPYNAGSSDVLGTFTVPEDGRYRIRLTDLFGGTRNDPANVYRLIVRRAEPDFAVVAWALHMGLRNGDRNALSKPIALRGGATIALEVVVVRRDGFDGEIDIQLEGLPEGVTATGLKIGKGKTRGILLISAEENAPRGLEMATIFAKANIGDQQVTRECRVASMRWPVTNARNEIPAPRLLDSFPISVGGAEKAGLSIAAATEKEFVVNQGDKLTIPLKLIRRGDFSGSTMSLQTFGDGFERNAKFDFSLVKDSTNAVLDLAKLKTPPGEYTIAFYGGAVQKYSRGGSKPKDIVDIYVSQPVKIKVVASEAKPK